MRSCHLRASSQRDRLSGSSICLDPELNLCLLVGGVAGDSDVPLPSPSPGPSVFPGWSARHLPAYAGSARASLGRRRFLSRESDRPVPAWAPGNDPRQSRAGRSGPCRAVTLLARSATLPVAAECPSSASGGDICGAGAFVQRLLRTPPPSVPRLLLLKLRNERDFGLLLRRREGCYWPLGRGAGGVEPPRPSSIPILIDGVLI